MHLARERTREVRRDGLGLGDLLRLQTLALEHVLEVHVAADVELVGAVQRDAAVLEQLRHDAVRDGGADLALDVVADDRDAGVLELLGPLGVGGDEHGQGVDEGDARVDRALRVELVGVLGAHREVGHDDVGLRVLEDLHDVDGRGVGLLDRLAVVLAETVERRAALDRDAGRRHVGDLDRVVLAAADRVGEVEADLLRIDVERGDELDVLDVVVTELDVHQTGHVAGRISVLVVLDALDQGRGAVAHAHNCHAYRTHGFSFCRISRVACARGHAVWLFGSGSPASSPVTVYPPARSRSMSSVNHSTSRSTDSRPWRWSSRV